MNKIFFIPDAHWPFHDEIAWQIAIKAAKKFRPDTLIQLGDLLDLNAVTGHQKGGGLKDRVTLVEELEPCVRGRKEMESVRAKRNVLVLGNHEDRLDRYIAKRAPELTGYIKPVWQHLGFDNGKWEIVGYKDYLQIGQLVLTHDLDYHGRNSVRSSLGDADSSVVIGHNHRAVIETRGRLDGRLDVGASFGWLGDVKQATYMHAIKPKMNWSHGVGYGYIDDDGRPWLHMAPIRDGRTMIEGKVIEL